MKQDKKSNKIVFFGVFGKQNLGNECTLQATMYNIHKALPDATFTCLSTVPEDTELRHGIPAFAAHRAYPAWLDSQLWSGRGSRLMKLLRKILFRIPLEFVNWAKGFKVVRGSHMFIVPGTQVVSDYLNGPFSWPYDIFKWAVIAKLCRARLLFLNIGVGPIYHPLSRWFIKASLNFSDYRSYRDYVNTLGDLVAWLCERKYTVRVIIGDVLYDSGVKQDFMELLHERGLMNQAGQIVNEPVFTVEQLLSQIAAIDFLVTSRFHNLVLALMLNKPVVCLSDHGKLDSLMTEIGLTDYCLPLANLGFDNLIDRLVKLEKNAEALRPYIKQKTEEYRRALDEQYSVISKCV